MTAEMDAIGEKLSGRVGLTDAEVEVVVSSPDILWLGSLADTSRRARHGDRVTYVRVHDIGLDGEAGVDAGEIPPGAREVRIVASPETSDQALSWAERVVASAGDVAVTAYALDHLADICGGEVQALDRLLRALRDVGVAMVAEASAETPSLREHLAACRASRMDVARLVIRGTSGANLVDLLRMIAKYEAEEMPVRAFAPLPRAVPPHTASGYADVRQVALARLLVDNIQSIQVDWALHGPKLAQVALTFGADDIDAVSPRDDAAGGRRRGAVEEITRNIRAAALVPVERTGRFERCDA